jgi:tetratricopeptide (TPR) repeat protein
VDGLKHAARALNAQNDMETLELLKKHGVTHISLMTWENFIEPYFHILYPKDASGKPAENLKESGAISGDVPKSPGNSFGIRALFQNTVPLFTRPLAFPKNQITEGLKQTVLMLEVAPEQTREEARLNLARFARIVEGNPVRAEFDLKELVDTPGVKFDANAELGALYLTQRRYDEAAKVFAVALESPDPAFRARVAALAAEGFLTGGRFAEARDVALIAARRDDATPDTLMNTAWFLATNPSIELRDAASANALIDLVENAPGAETAKVLLLRAAAAGAAGEYEKAVDFAQKAAETAPGNVEITEAAHQMAEAFRERKPWTPSSGQ